MLKDLQDNRRSFGVPYYTPGLSGQLGTSDPAIYMPSGVVCSIICPLCFYVFVVPLPKPNYIGES